MNSSILGYKREAIFWNVDPRDMTPVYADDCSSVRIKALRTFHSEKDVQLYAEMQNYGNDSQLACSTNY